MPDYFTLFNLPHHLHIDLPALEKSFYAQSRKLHPDRFAARPQAQQDEALAASSHLNDAYRTLRDPILRTQYLLSLEGVELEEQSKSATEAARTSGTEKKQLIPPELLEEVFDLNMQLMELKATKEFGGQADPEALANLESTRQSFDAKMSTTQTELESLWTQWDTALDDPTRTAAKDAMVALLNKRTYLRNLLRDASAALEP